MVDNVRHKAAQTAVDGFKVVERLYRHAYQILTALKDEIKTELNLKNESPQLIQSQSSSVPKSWIHHFRGMYLSHKKFSLDEYTEKEIPILFLQTSLFNQNNNEPVLRYGIVEKIFNLVKWKNARFDDYFRLILVELHAEPSQANIKTPYVESIIHFDEKPLLDIRDDSDITTLVEDISKKYGKFLLI